MGESIELFLMALIQYDTINTLMYVTVCVYIAVGHHFTWLVPMDPSGEMKGFSLRRQHIVYFVR